MKRAPNSRGVAVPAVASAEVAFEIHTPELIWRGDFSERLRVRTCSTLLLFGIGEPRSVEDVAEGAGRGPVHTRLELLQACLQLPCFPAWVLAPEDKDRVLRGL